MEIICKNGTPTTRNPLNVYEQAQIRLEKIFGHFDNIYVSFSGGKDSGVLLQLCTDYIRKHCPGRKIGVFHLDYEIQYGETIRYVDEVLASNSDIFEVYRVCVPFKVSTCTSMFQKFWRPWDEEKKDCWVRSIPEGAYTRKDFPFFSRRMWDYDFQRSFARWLHRYKKAKRTCCLVGIRTQESLNRWRVLNGRDAYRFKGLKWVRRLDTGVYNAYPIYDWLTRDIWIANGKFNWAYNHLYDLYYQAGVPLEKQRVASPFISEARESLNLYRAIDPDMWGRMINRVNGINFTAIYSTTTAVGYRQKITLPEGYTWASYMQFLLGTLPENIRQNYLSKLKVSIKFWREKGGCLAESTIEKLRRAGVPITVGEKSNYRTNKRPVRMEYQIIAVPVEKVVANNYNPNVVAPPEMKLLELSIWEDGYTMPCVCYYLPDKDQYELVDGYHRYLVLKKSARIYEREKGLLPVAVIEKDISNRMVSTIRHNRARGTHNVELMSHIVAELTKAGMSDQWILKNIGMDKDELLRLKQVSGLAELFANKDFSISDEL